MLIRYVIEEHVLFIFDVLIVVRGLISPLSAKKAIWTLRQKIRNARIQREVHKIKNQWMIREDHFNRVHIHVVGGFTLTILTWVRDLFSKIET